MIRRARLDDGYHLEVLDFVWVSLVGECEYLVDAKPSSVKNGVRFRCVMNPALPPIDRFDGRHDVRASREMAFDEHCAMLSEPISVGSGDSDVDNLGVIVGHYVSLAGE